MLERLLHRIDTSGPILFDQFMEMCLYDAEAGFFTAGRVRPGERGDFVTSPEVSPLFGTLIGDWVKGVAQSDWTLLEVGAGTGSLLGPLVAAVPEFDPWVMERSKAARGAIADVVPHAGIAASLSEVPGEHAVVVMNEVLDNAPVALVRRHGGGWFEVAVTRRGETLAFTEIAARHVVETWADRFLGDAEPGCLAAVQIEAGSLIRSLFDRFDGLALCLIDYGGTSEELACLPETHVVRTYQHQRTGLDFLSHPGTTDITVDVNVDAVVAAGADCGAVVQVTTQSGFLLNHGATEVLERLKEAEHAAARSGDVMSQLKRRSDAVGLRALLDPSGFGTFRAITMFREPSSASRASVR